MTTTTANVGSANNWVYYAVTSTAEQVASDYTFLSGTSTSEPFAIVGVGFRISGYNGDKGYFRGAIWNSSGTLLGYSGASTPASSTAGSSPYFSYVDVNFTNNAIVYGSQNILVGFWRKSDSASYTTAWAFDTDQASTDIWYDNSAAALGGFTKNSNPYSTATICHHIEYVTRPGTPGTPIKSSISSSSATITWTAPDAGGGTISDYYVQQSVSPYTSWTDSTATVSGTTATITGLTNGTAYKFRVAAKNQVTSTFTSSSSQQKYSSASAVITPYGTPGAPTGFTVTSTIGGQADLSWTAPAVTGGGTLTYKVSYSVDSAFPTINTTTISGITTTSTSITGLNPGQLYYFRVVAVNTGSVSSANSTTQSVTIANYNTPTVNLAYSSFSTAVISWSGYNSGPPDNYKIRYKLSSSPTWSSFTTVLSSVTEFRIVGLNTDFNNNSYDFQVDSYTGVTFKQTGTLTTTLRPASINPSSYDETNIVSAVDLYSDFIDYTPLGVAVKNTAIPSTPLQFNVLEDSESQDILGHLVSLDNGLTWETQEGLKTPDQISSVILTSKDSTTWYVDLVFSGVNLVSKYNGMQIGIHGFCSDSSIDFLRLNTNIGVTVSATYASSNTKLRFELLKDAADGLTATTYTSGTHFTSYVTNYSSNIIVGGLKTEERYYAICFKSYDFLSNVSDASLSLGYRYATPQGLAYKYNETYNGFRSFIAKKYDGSSWVETPIRVYQNYSETEYSKSFYKNLKSPLGFLILPTATDTNSVSIGTKTFYFSGGSNKSYLIPGNYVKITYSPDPDDIFMKGIITSASDYTIDPITLVVDVLSVQGFGTYSDWTVQQLGNDKLIPPINDPAVQTFTGGSADNDIIEFRLDGNIQNFQIVYNHEDDYVDGGTP